MNLQILKPSLTTASVAVAPLLSSRGVIPDLFGVYMHTWAPGTVKAHVITVPRSGLNQTGWLLEAAESQAPGRWTEPLVIQFLLG